jgi:hypothetical protein
MTALLDKIFPVRMIERFMDAHLGEALSTTQITAARGLNPKTWDDRADTICELCLLIERKKMVQVSMTERTATGGFEGFWRRGDKETLTLNPPPHTGLVRRQAPASG